MRHHLFRVILLMCAAAMPALAQISMPGVENSVGYLASGTSVQPATTSESTPMVHGTFGNWTVMFHGNAVVAGIQQGGPRGGDKVFSTNWMMPMAQRQFGRHGLTVRSMISLEPATITKRRYPLLFQTGESAFGLAIIDGQHPHDMFMELAARYDFKVSDRAQVFVYGGPIGEAALGPTAFPHRASASENPVAVIGHHTQDSTHISATVITTGFAVGPLQLEGSGFHGKEPDENRWNIDTGKPDSFAARLTVAPTRNLVGQVSTGRIHNPEPSDPQLDTVRTTASLHHDLPLAQGNIASSLIWGRNKDIKNGSRRVFNSYNLESTVKFRARNWAWTRIENVDRDRTLLPAAPAVSTCRLCGIFGFGIAVPEAPEKTGTFPHVVLGTDGQRVTVEEEPIGRVQAYTFGYEREIPLAVSWLNAGLGGQLSVYGLPDKLKPVYGNRPVGAVFFLRLRPAGNMGGHMKMMHGR